MTSYLLAGGGTAGHVNPLLAVADGLRERDGDAEVLVLGTKEGLEARLVPERGYQLLIVDKVPFPRRPNRQAIAFPGRFRKAVAQVRAHIREHEGDVVVGLHVHGDRVGEVGEAGEVEIGALDHEVDIEREVRVARSGLHDGGAEGDVVHEVPVHDVAMDPIAPGLGDAGDFLAEAAEVGGEDGGGDDGFAGGHIVGNV